MLDCQLPDVVRQSVEQGPEMIRRDRLHLAGGHSRPARLQIHPVLPQTENPACRKQNLGPSARPELPPCGHGATPSNAHSLGGKLVMAPAISSTRSIHGDSSKTLSSAAARGRTHSDAMRRRVICPVREVTALRSRAVELRVDRAAPSRDASKCARTVP